MRLFAENILPKMDRWKESESRVSDSPLAVEAVSPSRLDRWAAVAAAAVILAIVLATLPQLSG
jgi:plasmid replication initiation protein